MKKALFFIASLILLAQSGYADSPLTSTEFYQAYLDVPIVKAAADNPNVLTEEMMDYLYDYANPLDVKMALINAVGWNVDRRLSTFPDYLIYCAEHFDRERYGVGDKMLTSEDLFLYATPDQMAVFVYLRALADYSNVTYLYSSAGYAMQRPVNKQSFMLPMALVWAQVQLEVGRWEDIYPAVERLFLDAEIKDMRPEAVNMIMDYINLYKKYADSEDEQ